MGKRLEEGLIVGKGEEQYVGAEGGADCEGGAGSMEQHVSDDEVVTYISY